MGDASVEAGQLVDSLKVTEVPTIILFSAGVEVDRVVGTDPMEVASHILKRQTSMSRLQAVHFCRNLQSMLKRTASASTPPYAPPGHPATCMNICPCVSNAPNAPHGALDWRRTLAPDN
eukprot:1185326-Prorocentrum_minimum.AAC.2